MPRYELNNNCIEIYFDVKPSNEIRKQMKDIGIWWNPNKMCWSRDFTEERLAFAKQLCSENTTTAPAQQEEPIHNNAPRVRTTNYGLKLKIKDIVNGDSDAQKEWKKQLKDFVNARLTEDNANHSGEAVSGDQEDVWVDCFSFIKKTLRTLSAEKQEYEMIFEYIMPGSVYERPDVLLLTNNKVLILEFKMKDAPQIDDNKDDVAQLIRYREWTENHHQVTKVKDMKVHSYLVCTPDNAKSGNLRSVDIINKNTFCQTIDQELEGETVCEFCDEWINSSKTEMPDMLKAIEILYSENRIPYISDVNKVCLDKVNAYINDARANKKKILILISGVPGAGKTAVGQSVVFEQNKAGAAEAVYLSGNGPLVEVLQDQINHVVGNRHAGENAVQGMKEFKQEYFDCENERNNKVPQQSVLIFDEAQRAWDAAKLGRGYSEPEGLLRVGEKIFEKREYAVVIGLYGNGQVIYKGEEKGMSLWEEALRNHENWTVILPENLSGLIQNVNSKIDDSDLFLPVSLRADFVDCSQWVEAVVTRDNRNEEQEKTELVELQKTSMQIFVTRDFNLIRQHTFKLSEKHKDWKYGLLISNFAEATILKRNKVGWELGFGRNNNSVRNGEYANWFRRECKSLGKACSVYGNQGLELDCPIVIFGGDYVMNNGNWIAKGYQYNLQKNDYDDPDTIVENNYRVLLTRARRQMILFIPNESSLDETYRYFVNMGVDELK